MQERVGSAIVFALPDFRAVDFHLGALARRSAGGVVARREKGNRPVCRVRVCPCSVEVRLTLDGSILCGHRSLLLGDVNDHRMAFRVDFDAGTHATVPYAVLAAELEIRVARLGVKKN